MKCANAANKFLGIVVLGYRNIKDLGIFSSYITVLYFIFLILNGFFPSLQPDPDRLEKLVEDLRKTHNDAKMRAKGLNAINNVLNSSSPSTHSKFLLRLLLCFIISMYGS